MKTDTPRTDACPRCNGNRMPFKEGDGKVIYYTCGSYGVPEGRFYQSDLCDAHQELAASQAEVERLKKELADWDYGTRAKREQTRAEKAEANLRRAIEIADVLRSGGSRACRELHHPKRDRHEYAEVCPVEERLEKASEELDGLKAALNQLTK